MNYDFLSKYLNFSGKLLLLILPLMLIVIFVVHYRDKNICQPKEIRLESNLNLIRENKNSILKSI
jgi:hypothetical protein